MSHSYSSITAWYAKISLLFLLCHFFSRPYVPSSYCHRMLSVCLSLRLSVTDVLWLNGVWYIKSLKKRIGSPMRATRRYHFRPPPTTPSPNFGVPNPNPKLAMQIAAKLLQIRGWLVLTAYRNSLSHYSMAPSVTPYADPFPQIRGSKPQTKTCNANCSRTGVDTSMVCYYLCVIELTIAYTTAPSSTA